MSYAYTHLDTFSGIGGNSAAFEMEGFRTVAFADIEPYTNEVLKRHWPNVPNFGAVENITSDRLFEYTGLRTVDVITGGFPCQPHSTAGRRQASRDERDLWDECARMLGDVRPKFALFENVSGITSSEKGLFLHRVYADVARLGYACLREIVPASFVGAAHRRIRNWFLLADPNQIGLQGVPKGYITSLEGGVFGETSSATSTFSHQPQFFRWGNHRGIRKSDGIPNRMDRIAALGNSIVPQVAQVFARAIRQVLDSTHP